MYLFAHLGLGYTMVESIPRLRKLKLSTPFILLGTVLPDLIDKPIYYALVWLTGLRGEQLGMIAGTRTFGHTLLFCLGLFLFARWLHSNKLLALALGVLTHLTLDQISDLAISHGQYFDSQSLLWPILGWNFPATPFKDFSEQLNFWTKPVPLISESLGLISLCVAGFMYWRRKRNRKHQDPC